jgi:hypothetical protein
MFVIPRSSCFVLLFSDLQFSLRILLPPLVESFAVQSRKTIVAAKWRHYFFQHRQPSTWQPFTQVISDVDDTIKSSGGVKIGDVALGGIDTQYERGEFYPG